MCTKYEVSMSNAVPGGGVHRCQCQLHRMMHDRQFMIVEGSLVEKPNEPKKLLNTSHNTLINELDIHNI